MKGIIFTEFIELVETEFGSQVLEEMFDLAQDKGVYTSVGSYDHKLLVSLIVALSKLTNVSAEDLQATFGKAIFAHLHASIPSTTALKSCNSTFQFLRQVENYIHIEVKKLYPDAKPPKFDFIKEDKLAMTFDYYSARCMSHVCLGLIKGCAEHFDESIGVTMNSQDSQGSHVRFQLCIE